MKKNGKCSSFVHLANNTLTSLKFHAVCATEKAAAKLKRYNYATQTMTLNTK